LRIEQSPINPQSAFGNPAISRMFPVFAILAFVVLRLSFRARWRTLLLLAVVIGLLADFAIDLLVMLRH
jgi:prepilin signal peptidase PulO-like enzyme (type II secretory pathway)